MREHRLNSPLTIVCLITVTVFLSGCGGWLLEANRPPEPPEAGPTEFGSLIRVEPGDEFGVTLLANGAFPGEPWQIVGYDDAIIEFEWLGGPNEARTPGNWDTREDPGPHVGPRFLPETHFGFAGTAYGESQLIFEIRVDGQRVDMYEVTVAVVEDACAGFEYAYMVVFPDRCYG